MTFIYDIARFKFATGELDWQAPGYVVILTGPAYVPNRHVDQYISQVPRLGLMSARMPLLNNKVMADGACYADGVIWPALITTDVVTGALVVAEDGTLVAYADASSVFGFGTRIQGEDLYLLFDNVFGGLFQL